MPAPAAELFAWHTRAGAFERLTPSWLSLRVVEREGGLYDGDRVVLELRRGPFRFRWVAVHEGYREGVQFVDRQVSGPFARFIHTHRVRPDGPQAAWLEDHVDYALPAGALGQAAAGRMVARDLDRFFRFRHARVRDDLARLHEGVARSGRTAPLRVVISGASGLVGSHLAAFLRAGGHRVDRLVRRPTRGPGEIRWDPAAGDIEGSGLEGADAVVHLAGESIASGRWTAARKREIRESRVDGTRVLAEALARLERPPKVLVSASAVGIYGNRGGEPLVDESRRARPGSGWSIRAWAWCCRRAGAPCRGC